MAQSRFLNSFLTWFSYTTDSPLEFGQLAGLSALSAIALGRRWINYTDKLHPNIFGMIVGDSGVARKGTALKRAKVLIKEVEPGRVGPTDYTSEALYGWMSQNKDPDTGKGRQKLILFADEFGSDLARMAAYASTMKADFCHLYDCEPIDKIRKGGREGISIPNPRVSFLAACAYPMMTASLNPNDWFTGYLMRFLYVAPIHMRQTWPTPPPAQPMLERAALIALQSVRDDLRNNAFGLTLSPAAEAIYAKSVAYHSYYVPKSSSIMTTYVARFWVNILKLGLIYQLDIDPLAPHICEEAMRRAIEFGMEICWPSFTIAFEKTAASDFYSLATMVGTMIHEAGDKGLLRTVVATRFMARRELTDVLNWFKNNRITTHQLIQKLNGGSDELIRWSAK